MKINQEKELCPKLTITFGEEASRAIEKIQALTGVATPQRALQKKLGNEVCLLEHVAKGYQVELHKRGARTIALDLNKL